MILLPKLARQLEEALDLAPDRLTVEAEIEIIPGKSALSITGNPPLTTEESKRVWDAIVILNAALGGSPVREAPKG